MIDQSGKITKLTEEQFNELFMPADNPINMSNRDWLDRVEKASKNKRIRSKSKKRLQMQRRGT